MKPEDRFEKIWIDLREFGWGIRQVRVIWPEGHEGGEITPGVPIPRDTVDSAAIQDETVEMVDLSPNVKGQMMTQDDRVSKAELDDFKV